MLQSLKAACGINCKQCPAYIAHQTNDNELRAKTATAWNKQYQATFKPEDINCVGCLVDGVHSGYCFACPIRQCVSSKQLPYCAACSDFATCSARQAFEQQSKLNIKELCS